MQPVRIVIVEANEVGRHGLKALLQNMALPVEVVSDFASVDGLEAWLQSHSADVLLISDDLPRVLDLPHLLRKLCGLSSKTKIIVLSHRLQLEYIQRLIAGGVRGFVVYEDKLADKLHTALTTVLNGELYLSPRASMLPFTQATMPSPLSNRDLQVLRLMAADMPVEEIAADLGISRRAVYRAREHLRHALGVRTSEQIVGAAMQAGLLAER